MNMYDKDYLYDAQVTNNLRKLSDPFNEELSQKNRLFFLSQYLNIFPFFQRIKEEVLCKKYIDKIEIIDKLERELITIPPNDKVVVILNGQVVMREHRLDTPEDFEVKFVGKSGHILFNKELDEGNSN